MSYLFEYTKKITATHTERTLIWHNKTYREPNRKGRILSQFIQDHPHTTKPMIYILNRFLYEVDEPTPYEKEQLRTLCERTTPILY